ncbi:MULTISPECIES: XrtA/PEP-CTERM system TPR-repeat protein PrsT [unclassified Colwellia]|uniref:XrtA/PEP-CTERM system TPR-repeat protein PrsT n=1 Tax=unclassified Colwellia TaxID=196834 RepID=UPI0015F75F44|nr:MULTISPECIES: XrtA/PEP-CTERM system TPR-repeat protein PrsT [unclassified Colwellia]MBA6377944.1 PEP-CTERM system TPR-repeat protein PrsT [Colwellia sp. BRX10-7]MBA6387590.1 PEP-CTERM system TPR-repeat protein PrsT [Colwellia sp. BRX10-2]MBA6400952.1 PEP-CTERM system TPR-repeat protein PrsT [Colwellia sp. BRX10-5]MBA6404796.1 PEP-CTERM system TPR-repeat protein PrsT [Colwellia sp. BRX10-1]
MKFSNKLIITMAVAFSLAACSPQKTANEYIQSAKSHVANGNSSAAILELKNAISIELENPESRLLLGTLYLEVGDIEAAEKELTKSLELNGPLDLILPKLFKALNLQDKSEQVITLANQNAKLPESVLPEILLYKALAHIKLGDQAKAEEIITQASEFSSESVYSQLGEAYIMAESTNITDALSLIEKILVKTPELTEALILKGQLLFIQGDFNTAITSFNKFYLLLPTNTKIRLFLANSYVRAERYSEADEHLDFLLKIIPEHPFTNQLKGLVYYQKGDYENALAHTDKAIQNGLNVSSNRIVAGLSAFKLQQYERAHHFLITLDESLAPTHPVRKVLAVVQLKLGYSSEAASTLKTMDGATADDINLLTTASFELLKAGKFQEAKALVTKTNDIDINNPQDIAKIGILKLSMNDLEGITDLEKASEIDPDLPIAKFALASAYIQNKEYQKALDLAAKWKETKTNEIEGYNLTAKILLLKNEIEKAEHELELALNINEYNPYSLIYFTIKEFGNKKYDKSLELVEKLLERSPYHLAGLRLQYKAYKKLDKVNIAISRIEKSYIDNIESQKYLTLYAEVLFIEKNYIKVIDLLSAIDEEKMTQAIYWVLLGDSYMQLDKNEKALDTFNRWLTLQPQYRVAWLRKVTLQENLKDYLGALSTTNSALKIAPDNLEFKLLNIHFLIITKDFVQAQEQLDGLTNDQGSLPLAQGLQAKIWLSEGKFKEAVQGIKGLYKELPSTYNGILVFSTLKKVDQEKAAFTFIKKHVEKFPDDLIIQNLLAESALKFDKPLAQAQYTLLLDKSPDDLSILNNLAWVEYELGNFQSANKYADKALVINNNHPEVLDTAALIKLQLGDKNKAIELLKRAVLLAPKNKEIAKHYQDAIR